MAASLDDKVHYVPLVFEQTIGYRHFCAVMDPYLFMSPSYLVYLGSGVPGEWLNFAWGLPFIGMLPHSFYYFSLYLGGGGFLESRVAYCSAVSMDDTTLVY